MICSVETSKSLLEIGQALRAAALRHKFGVLNVLDLRKHFVIRESDLGHECRVYDVCNPQAASTALAADLSASVVLPCRISIYDSGEKRTLATVKPTDLMKATGLAGVSDLAADIEGELISMMNESTK